MSAYVIDWLSLLGRWVHLITGIAWIGASFYFVWLDNHLLPPTGELLSRKGVGGELWAVHGGGFYNAQKYRVAPQVLPAYLHWFYWEAYSTFLSGFFLLGLLYYAQAEIYLIDPRVAHLSKPAAIAIGVAVIVGGWLIYDALCRSVLKQRDTWLAAVLALLFSAAAFALCRLFSGRGAFIEFGAMLGTIMVANVFFVIIPGQREMVRAKREGRDPDPEAGLRGKLRSVHNTYFTLPVLFTMISNHYAMTFGAHYNWLVLIALCAAGVLIRVYFVARPKRHERGRTFCRHSRRRRESLRPLSRRRTDPTRIRDGAQRGAARFTCRASDEPRADRAAGRHAGDAHREPHGHDRSGAQPTAGLDSTWRPSLTRFGPPCTAARS